MSSMMQYAPSEGFYVTTNIPLLKSPRARKKKSVSRHNRVVTKSAKGSHSARKPPVRFTALQEHDQRVSGLSAANQRLRVELQVVTRTRSTHNDKDYFELQRQNEQLQETVQSYTQEGQILHGELSRQRAQLLEQQKKEESSALSSRKHEQRINAISAIREKQKVVVQTLEGSLQVAQGKEKDLQKKIGQQKKIIKELNDALGVEEAAKTTYANEVFESRRTLPEKDQQIAAGEKALANVTLSNRGLLSSVNSLTMSRDKEREASRIMREEDAGMRVQIRQLSLTIERQSAKLTRLQNEKDNVRESLTAAVEQEKLNGRELAEKARALAVKYDSVMKDQQTLQLEAQRRLHEIQDLKQDIARQDDHKKIRDSLHSNLQDEHQQLHSHKERLELDVKSQKQLVGALTRDKTELEGKLSLSAEQYAELQADLGKKLDILTAQVGMLSTTNTSLQSANLRQNTQIKTLNAAVKSKTDKIHSYESEVQSLTALYDGARASYEAQVRETEKSHLQIEQQEQNLAELAVKHQTLQEAWEQEREALTHEYEDYKLTQMTKYVTLAEKYKLSKTSEVKANEQVLSLKETIIALQATIAEQSGHIQGQNLELDMFRRQQEELLLAIARGQPDDLPAVDQAPGIELCAATIGQPHNFEENDGISHCIHCLVAGPDALVVAETLPGPEEHLRLQLCPATTGGLHHFLEGGLCSQCLTQLDQ